jgi:phage repressor protein C with HTH and peptisase S24 domain
VDIKKEIGERIKEIREGLYMKQVDLAELVGLSRNTIINYEKGRRDVTARDLVAIAHALNVSFAYLIGEKGAEATSARIKKMVDIPLLSIASVASCGVGGVDMSTVETISITQSTFSTYSEDRKPFGITTEGNSMEGAGITEGSIAIINPAEEVRSGDVALVCLDDNWFIKWVIYKPNGEIELRSANSNYQPITVDKEYASDPSWFRIIGKVVWIDKGCAPSRAF